MIGGRLNLLSHLSVVGHHGSNLPAPIRGVGWPTHPKNSPSLALYDRSTDREKRSHPTIAHPKNSLSRCEFSGTPGPLVGRFLEMAEKMQSVGGPGGANKRGQAEVMRILGDPGPSYGNFPDALLVNPRRQTRRPACREETRTPPPTNL